MADDNGNGRDNGHARHMDRWLLWVRPLELIAAFLLGMYIQALRYGQHERRLTDIEISFDKFKTERTQALDAFKQEQANLHSDIKAALAILLDHMKLDEQRFQDLQRRR